MIGGDEKTNGGCAGAGVADPRRVDGGWIGAEFDQSGNCGGSCELCAELPLAQHGEDRGVDGIDGGGGDLVAAGVLFGDSVQGAIAVVADFRGVGAGRVCHSGEAERQSARGNGPV